MCVWESHKGDRRGTKRGQERVGRADQVRAKRLTEELIERERERDQSQGVCDCVWLFTCWGAHMWGYLCIGSIGYPSHVWGYSCVLIPTYRGTYIWDCSHIGIPICRGVHLHVGMNSAWAPPGSPLAPGHPADWTHGTFLASHPLCANASSLVLGVPLDGSGLDLRGRAQAFGLCPCPRVAQG